MADRLLVEELTDGGVRVLLRRSGQEIAEPSAAVTFPPPLMEADLNDLRWYLEDYLRAPYAVYEERGRAIEGRLRAWGETLFAALFGAGKPGRDLYLQAREGAPELAFLSHSPAFLGLPWELLKDPERELPLALAMPAFDRSLRVAGAAVASPPGDVLRVLIVIARPSGLADVGYQMMARPLLQRLDALRGKVALTVLRPPTLERLSAELHIAAEAGEPYHILHFDGHGTFGRATTEIAGASHFDAAESQGYLAFESESGGEELVSADQFAVVVNQGRVPVVVLNACRSGMLGKAAVEAAVATRLLEGGAASVIATGYSVYAVAAAEFMAMFYEVLFAGETMSAAVAAGRQRLFQKPERPSPKGPLALADWIVPVHYLRQAIEFSQLRRPRASGLPSLDALLAAPQNSAADPEDALTLYRRFIGRDAAFYALEQGLRRQRVVVVHGPAGTGKTELAKAFGRWWRLTGGVERDDWIFFYAFEPGLATFGLDAVIRAVFASVWKRVTAMVEPAACVGRGDAVEGGGEGSFERVGGARLDSAQDALELGPAGFDGRKIGRVTRQVKELEPGFGQGGLDRLGLVRGQIVHQHGGARMAAAQFGDQHGL